MHNHERTQALNLRKPCSTTPALELVDVESPARMSAPAKVGTDLDSGPRLAATGAGLIELQSDCGNPGVVQGAHLVVCPA